MIKVGLTGGIACGKSYTLKEFERLGAHPIDADVIAHGLIEPGRQGYQAVVDAFGSAYLAADRTIDRKKLGNLIFSDSEARNRLNAILHPLVFEEEARIREALENDLSNLRPSLSVTDAALLVETGWYKQFDVVVVVYCRSEIQLCRLMFRDQITEKDAWRRIQSQMPVLEKVRYADYVIDNSGKLSDTRDQIHHTFADLVNRFSHAQAAEGAG